MDEANALSTYWYMIGKDCPAKTWWNLPVKHRAVNRALGIRPDDYGAVYALAPFRLQKSEDGARILAAWPAPALFDEPDFEWLGIEQVIAWDPVTDTATIVGDPAPQLAGRLDEENNVVFTSPRGFFQQWAARRARFAVERRTAKQGKWHIAPKERDCVPGALLIGDVAKIRWQPASLPSDLQCVGIDPNEVRSNRATLENALVAIEAQLSKLRPAA